MTKGVAIMLEFPDSDDLDPAEAYAAINQVFAVEWDDPKMSDYDNYEQHAQPPTNYCSRRL
jgi:hypothetical protein